MARREARPRAERERVLRPARRCCPGCGRRMPIRYENRRTVATLDGPVRLRLKVRRGEDAGCVRPHRPYRPEAEGAIALPQHEFGLDVIALVGALRYREHRSVPEIHRALRERGVAVCERTVTNLLDRYDELVATVVDEPRRAALAAQGGSCWRSTACSLASVTRSCGSSATACPTRSCSPARCSRPPRPTSPGCCARSSPRSACRPPGS